MLPSNDLDKYVFEVVFVSRRHRFRIPDPEIDRLWMFLQGYPRERYIIRRIW